MVLADSRWRVYQAKSWLLLLGPVKVRSPMPGDIKGYPVTLRLADHPAMIVWVRAI